MIEIRGLYIEVDLQQAYYETSGTGPVVLALHTAGRDSRQWQGVMRELGSDFTIVAPDLPGHGKSAPLPGQRCLDDIDDISDWLRAFMTALGVGSFAVTGCSLGGNLTLLLAASDDRVTAAVALQGADLTPSISDTSLELMTHPQVNLSYSNMDFTMSLVGSAADPAGRDLIEWGVVSVNGRAQRGDLTAYTRCDIRRRMPDVRVPITLVHGDEDWLVTRAMVEGTRHRLVNAPFVALVPLAGLGHFPHVEDPMRVAEVIRSAVRYK